MRHDELTRYLQKQAATIGCGYVPRKRVPWIPNLPSAKGPCLGILKPSGNEFKGKTASLALCRDGKTMITGSPNGVIRRWDLTTGKVLWQTPQIPEEKEGCTDIAITPDGTHLAALFWSKQLLQVFDTKTGAHRYGLELEKSPWKARWSPDSSLLAISLTYANKIQILDGQTGELRKNLSMKMPRGLDWSPDSSLMAGRSDAGDGIKVWSTVSWQKVTDMEVDIGSSIAFSFDGSFLASIETDNLVRAWQTGTWAQVSLHKISPTSPSVPNGLSWSPGDRLLAVDDGVGAVIIKNASSGEEIAAFEREGVPKKDEHMVWKIDWHPGGGFLAASYRDGHFAFWDTRPFLTKSAEHNGNEMPILPAACQRLAHAISSLSAQNLHPPYSLVRDLLDVLRGEHPSRLEVLAEHRGIRHLRALHWPREAQIGLVGLLLHKASFPEWVPPGGVPVPMEWIAEALVGEPIKPTIPAYPIVAMLAAADEIDDRLLTLLTLVGPEAVAESPGLPLLLLKRCESLPPLPVAQRNLLHCRIVEGQEGEAQGQGAGSARAGLSQQGLPQHLLAWQWALPDTAFDIRYQRRELLYRDRLGAEPPRLRPAVVVLDISPPAFGAVEAVTRPAAHIVAASLREAGHPVVLVLAGGKSRVKPIERAADLADPWTERAMEPADEAGALLQAGVLRQSLRGGALEPIVLLLTHAWFAADLDVIPHVPELRALFVTWPGHEAQPRLAHYCQRHHTLPADSTEDFSQILATLFT